MGILFAIALAGLFFATIFVLPAFYYWKRLGGDELTVEEWRLFRRWGITGNLVPFALWIFFNIGLITPPVWPTVAPMSAGLGAWWKSFDAAASGSAFFITSYW